jgi:hypothetical protein
VGHGGLCRQVVVYFGGLVETVETSDVRFDFSLGGKLSGGLECLAAR